jgi:hypothetical protein
MNKGININKNKNCFTKMALDKDNMFLRNTEEGLPECFAHYTTPTPFANNHSIQHKVK